ncbi:MAG: RNA polymerase-associated protein RapA [Methylococcaceae bacterium]|nr:RNA polymerase-associated protein RapA [Methylococcaceae bacterium]
MQNLVPGQRWINTLETQLGLGTVLKTEYRSVTILFNASGETRTYAKQSAPLIRVRFSPGDTIRSQEGNELTVQSLVERKGLITYIGTDREGRRIEMHESELDNFVRLDRPADRLFSGQFDPDKWLELRYQTLLRQNALITSQLRGLTGCRTSLIPHQLYIAHEVARRFAPRVLLADEVGLGKTIEAGLILHRQLITERAERVLIIVPESLVHQWLVEMIRRFNLFFSIFDESRCVAVCESSGHENPFFSEQLVLLSLDFLSRYPHRVNQAAAGEWDLLVVDEAHHLRWTPQDASLQYRIIEHLASRTKGLLLLTGTPEQLGKASHFASLRLLDPDRFHDLEAFLEEEKDYEKVETAIHSLLDERVLSETELSILRKLLAQDEDLFRMDLLDEANSAKPEAFDARRVMIDHLLDRHGTGRVLFRNTRAAIKGFPQRTAIPCPLSFPDTYRDLVNTAESSDAAWGLYPEVRYRKAAPSKAPHWTEIDPRSNWLRERIQSLRPNKILVITVTARTALELAEYLNLRAGITAAVFHEEMSLVERDRAAAFFGNPESGSLALICSEIGSEGRNFQFSHDLILFDLPVNPDLLEQRIGRLDRIGQTHTINIYIPYLKGSAQEILYRWYQEGLDAFANTCPTGHCVFVHVYDRLLKALRDPYESADALIESTRAFHAEQREMLRRGRDRLLEYNSCRPETARKLANQARNDELDSTLPEYMEQVFDCFGVDSEIRGTDCLVLYPADHLAAPFPCLPDDGVTITFNRETALANEHVQYITPDHPMVIRIMDQIRGSELGNSAFTALNINQVTPGTLILESLYIIEALDSERGRGSAYLAPTAVRVVIDENGKDYGSTLSLDTIRENQHTVDPETAGKFINARQSNIRDLIRAGEGKARIQAKKIRQYAESDAIQKLTEEINRLQALSWVNPNVRQEEIDFFREQLAHVRELIDSAPLRLDALRVLIAV